MYWVCNTHFQNAASCPTPPYHTPDIEQAFCRMYYKLKHHGDPIFHTNALKPPKDPLQSNAMERRRHLSQQENIRHTQSGSILTQLQQVGGVDPDTFISSNNKLSEQLRRLETGKKQGFSTPTATIWRIAPAISWTCWRTGRISSTALMWSCSMRLWKKIIVDSNERLRFRLKNGLELTEQIERTRR